MNRFWKPSNDLLDENGANNTEISSLIFPPQPTGPIELQRQCLPIFKHRRQILYAIENYSLIIIVGETGSGKSTQIPQYLVRYRIDYCLMSVRLSHFSYMTFSIE